MNCDTAIIVRNTSALRTNPRFPSPSIALLLKECCFSPFRIIAVFQTLFFFPSIAFAMESNPEDAFMLQSCVKSHLED